MASPDVLEQIAKLKTESREDFEKLGSNVPEFHRLLGLFPHLSSEYNEGGRQISLSFMGGYTEPAIRDAQYNRYQLYLRMLSKLKQIKPKIDIVTYFREFLRDLVVASKIGKMMAGGKYHNVYIPPADLAARIEAFKVRMIELGGDQQWYDYFNTVIRRDRDYFEYGRQSEIEKLSEFVTKKIRRERPRERVERNAYATVARANIRQTEASAARLEAARANIRNMDTRTAARRNAAEREAAYATSNIARIRETRYAELREAAAAEREAAAARNAAARNAREAEAAANKNKVKAPLNFWLRANGVRVSLEGIEINKNYILLVPKLATDSDDAFLVKKIGDRLYKVGKYTTDKNNKIVYNSMDEEQVEGEGVLELYKAPDSLQSGSGRKSRRNRRKSQKSRKSRKHH